MLMVIAMIRDEWLQPFDNLEQHRRLWTVNTLSKAIEAGRDRVSLWPASFYMSTGGGTEPWFTCVRRKWKGESLIPRKQGRQDSIWRVLLIMTYDSCLKVSELSHYRRLLELCTYLSFTAVTMHYRTWLLGPTVFYRSITCYTETPRSKKELLPDEQDYRLPIGPPRDRQRDKPTQMEVAETSYSNLNRFWRILCLQTSQTEEILTYRNYATRFNRRVHTFNSSLC